MTQITGTPASPMSKKQVEQKFGRMAEPVIGVGQSSKIIAMVDELERVEDVRELTNLYAPSGG